MITRGCTKTQFFTIPYDWESIDEIYVTYAQDGEVRIEKTKEDLTYNSDTKEIQVDLTREDTLCFSIVPPVPSRTLILIQIEIYLSNGAIISSEIEKDRLEMAIREVN